MTFRFLTGLLYFPFRLGWGFFIAVMIARIWSKKRGKSLGSWMTDKSLELLLRVMDLCFSIFQDLGKDLKDFEGTYVFKTADETVEASMAFKGKEITVYEGRMEDWDAMVIFQDAEAVRAVFKSLLLSGRLEILDLMLNNRVTLAGNVSYVFKFLFMVSDLTRKLGLLKTC